MTSHRVQALLKVGSEGQVFEASGKSDSIQWLVEAISQGQLFQASELHNGSNNVNVVFNRKITLFDKDMWDAYSLIMDHYGIFSWIRITGGTRIIVLIISQNLHLKMQTLTPKGSLFPRRTFLGRNLSRGRSQIWGTAWESDRLQTSVELTAQPENCHKHTKWSSERKRKGQHQKEKKEIQKRNHPLFSHHIWLWVNSNYPPTYSPDTYSMFTVGAA